MILFTVVVSQGEYDDYWSSTVGIYSTKELAADAIVKEQERRKLLADKFPDLNEKAKDAQFIKSREFYDELSDARNARDEIDFEIQEVKLDASIQLY